MLNMNKITLQSIQSPNHNMNNYNKNHTNFFSNTSYKDLPLIKFEKMKKSKLVNNSIKEKKISTYYSNSTSKNLNFPINSINTIYSSSTTYPDLYLSNNTNQTQKNLFTDTNNFKTLNSTYFSNEDTGIGFFSKKKIFKIKKKYKKKNKK